MPVTLAGVQTVVDASREAIGRELVQQQAGRMRIKKEATALRNIERIIAATLQLANQRGFASMSLRELSEAADMSMGGLYAYIRSKDDLVELIQAHGRALSDRVLQDALAGLDEPGEQLEACLRAHLYLSEIARRWFYFSYMEARLLAPEQRQQAVASERRTESLLADIIRAGQERAGFRQIDARQAAALLKALLQDWYIKRGKYRERGLAVEDYADSLLDLARHYLLIEGASP